MVKPNPNRKINKIQSYPFSNSDLQFKILTVRLTKMYYHRQSSWDFYWTTSQYIDGSSYYL